MEKTVFHQQEKQFTVSTFSIGFHMISVMVTTSKKNTIILKNTVSPRQKRILQLLFPLVETIIEIRKNPINQNNLLPAS